MLWRYSRPLRSSQKLVKTNRFPSKGTLLNRNQELLIGWVKSHVIRKVNYKNYWLTSRLRIRISKVSQSRKFSSQITKIWLMSMHIRTRDGQTLTSLLNSVHSAWVGKYKGWFGREWKKPSNSNLFSLEVGQYNLRTYRKAASETVIFWVPFQVWLKKIIGSKLSFLVSK